MSEDVQVQFKQFQVNLKKAIAKYGKFPTTDLTEIQKRQVETLAQAENEFRECLIADGEPGMEVYKDFTNFVRNDLRNILKARPYFRERQETFSEKVSVALDQWDTTELSKYHFNYPFVSWVMRNSQAMNTLDRPKYQALTKRIEAAREELMIMNMPLVIQRAKLFWGRTARSHISFMDLIQIGVDGLIAGIDKFSLPYTEVFRSVMIGRMVGNFIESNSQTLIHFYPTDRRKIYRANKCRARAPKDTLSFDEIAHSVNGPDKKGNVPKDLTDSDEIAGLIAGAAVIAVDSASTDPEIITSIENYQAPAEERPDISLEFNDARDKMYKAATALSLMDRKLLRLRGIPVALA